MKNIDFTIVAVVTCSEEVEATVKAPDADSALAMFRQTITEHDSFKGKSIEVSAKLVQPKLILHPTKMHALIHAMERDNKISEVYSRASAALHVKLMQGKMMSDVGEIYQQEFRSSLVALAGDCGYIVDEHNGQFYVKPYEDFSMADYQQNPIRPASTAIPENDTPQQIDEGNTAADTGNQADSSQTASPSVGETVAPHDVPGKALQEGADESTYNTPMPSEIPDVGIGDETHPQVFIALRRCLTEIGVWDEERAQIALGIIGECRHETEAASELSKHFELTVDRGDDGWLFSIPTVHFPPKEGGAESIESSPVRFETAFEAFREYANHQPESSKEKMLLLLERDVMMEDPADQLTVLRTLASGHFNLSINQDEKGWFVL